MKKNFFFAILGLTTVFFATSCTKSGTTAPPPPPPGGTSLQAVGTSPHGNWVGKVGNSNNGTVEPALYFALNLQANGVIVVSDNNAVTPDIANGAWSLGADSVRATYTFAGKTTTYSLACKYSTASNVMTGTIGLETSTTGAGVFSVTKQ